MVRSILVEGSIHPARLAGFNLVETARNGEVGMGGIDFDSQNAGYDINPHWDVSVQETDAAGMVFVGFAGDRDIKRGPFAIGSDRRFDLDLVDLNTLLGDRVLGTGSNRPAETDVARVNWLLGTAWAGGLAGNVGASGITNLDANNYVDRYARDVLTEAAETAGKLFFAYVSAAGVNTLFYDLAESSNYTSPARLSSLNADVDSSVTFAARKPSLHRAMSGGRIYSGIRFRYGDGTTSVFVENTATASNYRQREVSMFDASVKTLAVATVKANQFLASATEEDEVIECEVDLTSAQVNDIRAGQRIEVKFPHLGIPAFDWRRVVRRAVAPRGTGSDVDSQDYRLTLELSNPKSTRWRDRMPPPEHLLTSPPPSAVIETGATCSGTPEPHYARRRSETNDADEVSGIVAATHAFGSWVYYNIAYTVCDCPIGGGGWTGHTDMDLGFKFTAPADAATYLGLMVTINASAINKTFFTSGWQIRFLSGVMTRFGQGGGIATGPESGSVTVYIPRNLVGWGGENWLIYHPNWLCERNAFYCNDAADFSDTLDDGRGNSGQYSNLGISAFCVAQFQAGTTGQATDVAAYGAVDGVNKIFTLISWDGTGAPSFSINGLDQSTADVTFDTGAKTATLPSAT